jgi:protein involved in polysaccharide export with SLBB domain
MIGSVNRPSIFEMKPGERLTDLLAMAGGFSAVADRKRLTVERLDIRNDARVLELEMPSGESTPLATGDVIRALSIVEVSSSVRLKNKRVRIEGEVQRPGDFLLPATSTISDALRAAGGLTEFAYVFGAEFTRASAKATQEVNYDRALRELETDLTRQSSTQRTITADEAAGQAARMSSTTRLIDRLRGLKPTGRVVLELQPGAKELPDLLLEDGDRLYIPPKLTTVGVFGSVFNAGSYLLVPGRGLTDYLRLSGGPTKGADPENVMVIRANGSVVSSRQRQSSWFSSSDGLAGLHAEAGDTIFVPEEIDKTTFTQNAKDWTTIFYNFGLGAAAIKAIFR